MAAVDETPLTVGMPVSITRSLLDPSEPATPGAGNVSTASLPAPSRMLPPLSANAVFDT